MQLNRSALHRLKAWKSDANRKPLLIRGARQVGKTTLVRAFSKMFPVYMELNLEKEAENSLFEIDNTNNLISAIYLYKNVVPKNQPTLIFIDEIQESVKAIKQLRYFYEERPDLYIIAAGSLLEFAISKTANFPVGRIDYLYLHPLNFSEYLMALGNEAAIEVYEQIPAPEFAHDILINLFNQYALIGGMPEIVYNYLQTENLAALSIHYKKLWQSYKDDVEKYGQNDTEKKVIRHVIETAPGEKDRIKFEGFGHSNYRSREVGEAIRALDKAKLIQLIYPTTNLKPPIVSDYKKRPRLQFIDTGILNQALDLQIEMINLNALDHLYQGRVLQHLVTQELISIHQDSFYKPHFWVRESKDSNAEVDLVIQHHQYLIPIEVKSGSTGTLRSLHQFVDRSDHHFAIRIYSGKFNIEKAMTPKGKHFYLMNLPYFATGKIMHYIKYFFEQKPM